MNGAEPEYTNCAQVLNDDIFIDTLDYIFISDSTDTLSNKNHPKKNTKRKWVVKSVGKLPQRKHITGPLPSESEPSDHLMIHSRLELSNK